MSIFKKHGVVPKAPVTNKAEAKELASAGLTIEKGNFIFGRCESCDWSGKARRSRSSAKDDAHEHAKECAGRKKVRVEEARQRVAKHQ